VYRTSASDRRRRSSFTYCCVLAYDNLLRVRRPLPLHSLSYNIYHIIPATSVLLCYLRWGTANTRSRQWNALLNEARTGSSLPITTRLPGILYLTLYRHHRHSFSSDGAHTFLTLLSRHYATWQSLIGSYYLWSPLSVARGKTWHLIPYDWSTWHSIEMYKFHPNFYDFMWICVSIIYVNWKAPQVGAVGMRVNMSILNVCVCNVS
jgi:hypothetical protein